MSVSILVVGAGELGTAIVEGFSKHLNFGTNKSRNNNNKLAVMLRPESIVSVDPAKQQSNLYLATVGAEIVPGNFVDDPVSGLARTFERFDVVIQAGGYGLPAGTQLKSAQAALEAGVKHYFPWQFGMDYEAIGKGSSQELFDEMLEVRRLLRSQSTVEWTVVSTGLFMSYLFLKDFQVVDLAQRTVHALGSWENAITVTTPKDIGRILAYVVLVIPKFETSNQVVYVGGDTVTYAQLADQLSQAFQTGFKREQWSLGYLKGRLEQDPDNLWYKYQVIFGEGRGVSWDQSETLNHRHGIPMTSIDGYISENKSSWM